MQLPAKYQAIVDRFESACLNDDRIIAAFLGGSYTGEQVDLHSDLDLFFITTDEAYDDFLVERADFVRCLGKPLLLEDFGLSHGYCFILADGTEGDLWFGRESRFLQIYGGPYTVLVDKTGCLRDVEFPVRVANDSEQIEALRRQLDWFWHEVSHFMKAMGRGQLWFAYGQLEMMRQICVSLARMKHNFQDVYAGKEPYFKVEYALPTEKLSPLQATFCPMEYSAMRLASLTICQYYQDIAPGLAQEHNLVYQVRLEDMVMNQLNELSEDLHSSAQHL